MLSFNCKKNIFELNWDRKMNRYYKNFILCGDIDQYCLLCKETFYLILDIEKHIRWEKHRKHVKEQMCLTQFQTDLIYKIQNNYYCAICNLVMNNITSAKKHVKSENHELLKKEPDAIKKKISGQFSAGYIIIDNIIMNKRQWNSIADNRCHLCNLDIDNIDVHIANEEHIIKLIQCPSKYTDNQYYRKIDAERYHCFACKKIFTLTNFVDHWIRCEHNDGIQIHALQEVESKVIATDGGEGPSKMVNIEKELIDTLKIYYTVDEAANIATCKNCPTTLIADFRVMLHHMKKSHGRRYSDFNFEELPQQEVVDKGVRNSGLKRSELADYGKKLYIRMNHNGSKGYCKFCDKYISASKVQFNMHCKGITHQGYLEIVGLKKPTLRDISSTYSWKSFKTFIMSIENAAAEPSFWINGKYCIDIDSFFFFYSVLGDPHYKLIKCHACIEVMYLEQVVAHCNTMKHRVLFTAAKIVDIDGEFLREVRPFLYHCGFCNSTFPYSGVLEDHLKSKNHIAIRERKTLSNLVTLIRTFNPNPINVSADDDELYSQLLRYAGIFGPSSTTF